jgi:two-component system, NtrC family, sensor histidine kinase HydH
MTGASTPGSETMKQTAWKRWEKATLLVVAIGVISLLHYNTPTSHYWVHPLLQRAYYLPVLLMALWFGWRGGIAAAALAALSYIPHVAMAWQSEPEYRAAGYVEIGMFFVIGALTGVLADLERAQKKKIEETATKLGETYSELQASMEQLRRADRLSALGELSAGLAHEIRNPLGSLEGAVAILHRSELPEKTRQEFAEMAGREVVRLKGLLTNFLEFARPQTPQRTLTEPQLLLESVSQLAGETAKMAGVRIRIENSHSASIFIDAEQIKQVLLNLVLNAVQAMPAGGEVTLRSHQADGSVVLEVTDQGVGIPPENLERIFDPFFTTRAGGTGLGLSIAYQIINRHGGHLSVCNNRDRGVTFTVLLPASQSEVATTSIANALA